MVRKGKKEKEREYTLLNASIDDEDGTAIIKLSQEDLEFLMDDICGQVDEAEQEVSELKERICKLKDQIESSKQKKLYVEGCIHLGSELLDIVSYFNQLLEHKLIVVVAPKMYWNRNGDVIKIEEQNINLEYKKNCEKWLDRLESNIKNNIFGWSEPLSEVANDYVIPLIREKKKEIQSI